MVELVYILHLKCSAFGIVGSNPTISTIFNSTGSIPVSPTKKPRMMELVDMRDLESRAERRAGSNPASGTKIKAECMELVDRPDSKSGVPKGACGFDSHLGYHIIQLV